MISWQRRNELEDSIFERADLKLGARVVGVVLLKHLNLQTMICNPGIDRLAKKAGVSRAAVFRAIAELKEAGILAYTSCQGAGGKTNAYSFPDLDGSQPETGRSVRRVSACDKEGLNLRLDGSQAETGRVSGCDPNIESNIETNREENPHPQPPSDQNGGGGSACAPKVNDEETSLWQKFLTTYPADRLDPPAPAEQLFRALRIEDQRLAVDGLPTYLTIWKSRKRTGRHVGMRKWIHERRWEGLARSALGFESVADEVGVPVYDGTAPAKAWDDHLRKSGKRFIATIADDQGRRYARKATLWPERQPRTNPYFDGLTGRKPYDLQASEPGSPAPLYEIEGINEPLKDAGNVAAEVLVIARRRGQR